MSADHHADPSEPTIEFGRLEKASVRDAWRMEATDFTPWLARVENLAQLGEAIEIDLAEGEVRTEEPVGAFSCDIVVRTPEVVCVVENQFGRTDHDHLGKLLVYASGLDAQIVVWVAERLRAEHRAVLDWLNAHTPSDRAFFGVELELWRIAHSPFAPRFNVVSRPNEFLKATVGAAGGPLTPLEAERLCFWQELNAHAEEHGSPLRAAPPRPRSWHRMNLGMAGFAIQLTRRERNGVSCELRIRHAAHVAAFDQLEHQRPEIERGLAMTLDWRRMEDKKVSRIIADHDCDLADELQRKDALEWLARTAIAFEEIFVPRITALDLSDVEDEENRGPDGGDESEE